MEENIDVAPLLDRFSSEIATLTKRALFAEALAEQRATKIAALELNVQLLGEDLSKAARGEKNFDQPAEEIPAPKRK